MNQDPRRIQSQIFYPEFSFRDGRRTLGHLGASYAAQTAAQCLSILPRRTSPESQHLAARSIWPAIEDSDNADFVTHDIQTYHFARVGFAFGLSIKSSIEQFSARAIECNVLHRGSGTNPFSI